MNEWLKESLLNTLRTEYGITSAAELMEAIRSMEKLDITQFVCTAPEKGEARCKGQAVMVGT